MKSFTIFNENNTKDDFSKKILASSVFINQKYFEDFSIFTKSNYVDDLKNIVFANKNIKICENNVEYSFPKNFHSAFKITCASFYNEPFSYLSDKSFIWDFDTEKIKQYDFIFMSLDNSILNKKRNYYKIGLDFFKNINYNLSSIKDIKFENINFNIYNTSIIICNNNEIFKKYFESIREICIYSNIIDKYINELNKFNKIIYSNSLTKILDNFILSKIVHDNNLKCGTISNNSIHNTLNLINLPKFSLLNSKSNILTNKSNIEKLYSNILSNNYCSINNYISNFFKNDSFTNNTFWGKDLKELFNKESNSGGGCSSCKLKRITYKYNEILKTKFNE